MTAPAACPACGGPVRVDRILYDGGDGYVATVPGRWDCANECYLDRATGRMDHDAVDRLLAWGKPGRDGGRPYDWSLEL